MVDSSSTIEEILQNFPKTLTYFYTFELNNGIEYGKFQRSRTSTLEEYAGELAPDIIRILNYYISRDQANL